MRNPSPLNAISLLALVLSTPEAANKLRAATDNGAPAFLAALLAGKCDDPACQGCNPAQQANGDSQATEGPAAAAQDSGTDQAAQETLVASGGISQSACRAVGLTDSDTGQAAQLKGTAAALITELEDLRDSLLPGHADRLTAEGQIGAVAQACSWAISRLPKQAA
ncbi:hypothetical protein [Pantoea sp. 18069]|uniref:hypothetical protein n=1 Tax=Pantoea sp. 18069 TaxID=2681415 RepID=UPI0013597F2B|nr:hypothetical protein [Pantoea sp. 18069]